MSIVKKKKNNDNNKIKPPDYRPESQCAREFNRQTYAHTFTLNTTNYSSQQQDTGVYTAYIYTCTCVWCTYTLCVRFSKTIYETCCCIKSVNHYDFLSGDYPKIQSTVRREIVVDEGILTTTTGLSLCLCLCLSFPKSLLYLCLLTSRSSLYERRTSVLLLSFFYNSSFYFSSPIATIS